MIYRLLCINRSCTDIRAANRPLFSSQTGSSVLYKTTCISLCSQSIMVAFCFIYYIWFSFVFLALDTFRKELRQILRFAIRWFHTIGNGRSTTHIAFIAGSLKHNNSRKKSIIVLKYYI